MGMLFYLLENMASPRFQKDLNDQYNIIMLVRWTIKLFPMSETLKMQSCNYKIQAPHHSEQTFSQINN